MRTSQGIGLFSAVKLAVTLALGASIGAVGVVIVISPTSGISVDHKRVDLPVPTKPVIATEITVPELSERERQVLSRLASLPDLPVVRAPAFDLKVQETTGKTPSTGASGASKVTESASMAAGESVMARIQVVSVEKGRVFYRSVDEQLHTARPGERLLGLNGHVLAVDEHGAELQIDGQHMHVTANNM